MATRYNFKNYEQLMRVLDNGFLITGEEMAQVANIVRGMKLDADRYRWLNKYTAQLFMVTPEEMNAQVDKAMGKGEMK